MAASSAVPGVVDSTKPKSYPVILSDALLGKTPREAITAIRYNHRPTLSSDIAPNSAEIKPSSSSTSSSSSTDGTFDLSFYENGGKYAFNGTRTTKENQYVLLFDPERKAFVLHRLDSMFNMNVTRTPTNNDADDLREKHPHIDGNTKASTVEKKGGTRAPTTAAGKAKENKKGAAGAASSSSKKKDAAPAKAEPQQPAESKSKSSASSSQQAQAAAAAEKEKKKRNRSPVESEEEDDDDDGGLLVEYPDPAPSGPLRQDFSPAFPTTIRRFSEFVNNEKSESDEDADAEYDEDDILGEDDDVSGMGGDGFKLPNPVGGPNSLINNGVGSGVNDNSNSGIANDVVAEEEDDDGLGDLEKELEKELGMDVDSESSVSEED
ncbi:hypothetical protein VP1G_04941 [Cytospora mali]|uniref:Transcription elongation factor Eaf N-terminal domain-containing protein n=1 Tax=Cytospora mali TaxID=578113 RepID=A0A194V1B2_CYTMA|nr:hypothetical protein VP1G_04941 [Valsa mali var. pyri (nom. inval.)]